MKIARKWSAFALLVMVLAGCEESDNSTYTLYRNSFIEGNPKVHVASFDSSDGKYNRNTCDLGRELFQKNLKPGWEQHRYWCEHRPGRIPSFHNGTYTLYLYSLFYDGNTERIHVASFDSNEGEI